MPSLHCNRVAVHRQRIASDESQDKAEESQDGQPPRSWEHRSHPMDCRDDETRKLLPFWDAFSKFVNNATTLHGVPQVYSGGRNFRRCCWMLLSIFGVVVWVALTYTVVTQYFDAPYAKNTIVQRLTQGQIKAPNFTICASDRRYDLPELKYTLMTCMYGKILVDGCLQGMV